jgi:hypothetical protein
MKWQINQLAKIQTKQNDVYYIRVTSVCSVGNNVRGIGFDHMDVMAIGYLPIEHIGEVKLFDSLVDMKAERDDFLKLKQDNLYEKNHYNYS